MLKQMGFLLKKPRNLKVPFDFRFAEKYGMVRIEEWDGKFYYEKREK